MLKILIASLAFTAWLFSSPVKAVEPFTATECFEAAMSFGTLALNKSDMPQPQAEKYADGLIPEYAAMSKRAIDFIYKNDLTPGQHMGYFVAQCFDSQGNPEAMYVSRQPKPEKSEKPQKKT